MPFMPEPTIGWIPAPREQVVAVIESINQPQVSIPGKTPQQVSGHLCGVRNGDGSISIFVGLHLPTTGENVVYVHDRRRLTIEEYRAVELEALQFLESMGFMLDNLNFRNLSPQAQEQAMKRIPLFSPPRAAADGGGARRAADPARVARLLASF